MPKDYNYHGGKSQQIRDLAAKEVEKRLKKTKKLSLAISALKLREAIKDKMDRPFSKLELINALLNDHSRPDGDVVINKHQGVVKLCFHSLEVMAALEIVYEKLAQMENPATKPPLRVIKGTKAA